MWASNKSTSLSTYLPVELFLSSSLGELLHSVMPKIFCFFNHCTGFLLAVSGLSRQEKFTTATSQRSNSSLINYLGHHCFQQFLLLIKLITAECLAASVENAKTCYFIIHVFFLPVYSLEGFYI